MKLELSVGFPSDVLGRYYPNGKLGGLTFDGAPPGNVGQLVLLTVKVERPLREFEVKGQIAWARHKGSLNLKACFGVDFIGDHERLLQFARAELDPAALRLGPRLATDLPVRITHRGVTRKEFLVDLSDGGAFVRSPDPIAVGQEVELHLKPPRALLGFTLTGRVAWQRNTGNSPGFGVEFDAQSVNARPKLEKLLLKLSES
ncbi:MAG: PilZ domain-containing protein [Myxococcaceae bacterium]|nr:PilZ domain-containing protein [Myxococcaceae bacterium]